MVVVVVSSTAKWPLLGLDKLHRGDVALATANDVVHGGKQAGGGEHDDGPVEVGSPGRVSDGGILGEEGEDEADHEGKQGHIIDQAPPFAQRPARWQQRLAAESLEPDAADRDDVGE